MYRAIVLNYYNGNNSLGYSPYNTCYRPLHINSGRGKREAHLDWSIVIPEKVAPVTRTTVRAIGLVPADSRQ